MLYSHNCWIARCPCHDRWEKAQALINELSDMCGRAPPTELIETCSQSDLSNWLSDRLLRIKDHADAELRRINLGQSQQRIEGEG